MEPVASEIFKDKKTSQYVVAMVKKTSPHKSLNELKGGKVCMSQSRPAAGWVVPISALLKTNAIQANNCPRAKAMSEFFTGGVKESDDLIHCLDSEDVDVIFVGAEEVKMALGKYL